MRWNIGPHTSLVLEAEFLERDQVNQPDRYYDRSRIGSSSNGWLDEIYSFVDLDTRYVDAGEIKNNRADTYALEFSHRFSDKLYMRLGSYFIDRADRETSTNRRGFATTFGALRDREGNVVLDGQGNEIPAIGRHWASDNSLNRWQSHQLEFDYALTVGEFENNFLLGMDISKDVNDRLLYEDRDFLLIEDAANPGTAPAGFRSDPVGGPGTGRPLGWLGSARKLRWSPLQNPGDLSIDDARWDPVSFQYPWLEYQDNIENDAIYLNWLDKLSGGRLHTLAGLRYDESSKDRFSTGAVGAEAPWSDDYLAPQAGAIFKVSDNTSLYGFYSESFDPQNGCSNSFNVQFDPLVGEQMEVGLKGSWLDGGLVGTLSLFEVTETNRVFFDPDAPNAGGGFGDNVAAGEVDSTGFDMSVYGNLSEQWSFIFNASQVSVEQTVPETQVIDNFEGVGLSFSMWNKYRITEGSLEGLSLGLGFIYTDEWDGQDGPGIGYASFQDPDNSNQFLLDADQPFYDPSETRLDLWIGFKTELSYGK